MTCWFPARDGSIESESKEQGIYCGHAYTILGLEEEQGHYFIKIRNPWGKNIPYDGVDMYGNVKRLQISTASSAGIGRIEIMDSMEYFNDIRFYKLSENKGKED